MRKTLKLAILSLCLIGLTSCSAKFTPLPPDGTILAFGDSLTVGYGTTLESSYPSVLEKISGHKVINAGISGETTAEGLQRFVSTLDETKPALVILMEGGNDILRNIPNEQTKNNLNQMIITAKTQNIQLLLIGIPEKKLFSSSAELYSELAKQNQIPLDDETVAKLVKDPRYKSDYVHLNEQGYHLMAEAFYNRLRKDGALP